MPLGPKAIPLLLLLILGAAAQAQEKTPEQQPLSRSFVVKLAEGAAPLTVALPEGYGAMQQSDGNSTMIFAPWNEFFYLVVAPFNQADPAPINSEARMSAELDAFSKANAETEFVDRKQWVDPKGPRGSFESFEGVKPKRKATHNLVLPGADHLLVITTHGDESSLPDQRLIQELLLKEINAQ